MILTQQPTYLFTVSYTVCLCDYMDSLYVKMADNVGRVLSGEKLIVTFKMRVLIIVFT